MLKRTKRRGVRREPSRRVSLAQREESQREGELQFAPGWIRALYLVEIGSWGLTLGSQDFFGRMCGVGRPPTLILES